MGFTPRHVQALSCFRNRYEMHLISHQTISPDLYRGAFTLLRQKFNICPKVITAEECQLPPIPPLPNMMRNSGHNYPCDSWPAIAYTKLKGSSQVKLKNIQENI